MVESSYDSVSRICEVRLTLIGAFQSIQLASLMSVNCHFPLTRVSHWQDRYMRYRLGWVTHFVVGGSQQSIPKGRHAINHGRPTWYQQRDETCFTKFGRIHHIQHSVSVYTSSVTIRIKGTWRYCTMLCSWHHGTMVCNCKIFRKSKLLPRRTALERRYWRWHPRTRSLSWEIKSYKPASWTLVSCIELWIDERWISHSTFSWHSISLKYLD